MNKIELYKHEIELFLGTLSIYKGTEIINKNEQINAENRAFLKKKFFQIKSGNVDEEAFDVALNELLPYLYQK